MPTISDVARAAGVGVGTVSRVINNSPLVSAAMRQRVLQAIEQLGYEPSPVAQAFARGRTYKLEVLVPRAAAPFCLELLQGVDDALADTDFALVVHGMDSVAERDRTFATCCRRGRADGVLLMWAPPTDAFVDQLLADGLPLVLLNAVDRRVSSVTVDHRAAALDAAAYCLRLGHRRLALLDRFVDPFATSGEGICKGGFQAALEAADLPETLDYEITTQPDPNLGAAAVEALLDLTEPPTAIIVGSDAQAVGALHAVRGRGRQVPGDVSIVSYNENPISAFLGLTTLRLPLRDMARRATELLLGAMSDPLKSEAETVLLPTELVVRATCGPPPR